MIKIAFVANGETPAYLLELFKRQTPERSGIWGELQGVDSYDEADVFVVSDDIHDRLGRDRDIPGVRKIELSRCVFLGTHPESVDNYRDTSRYKCRARTDIKDHVGKLEWWINYDYDFLKALRPPEKTSPLGCIMSDSKHLPCHKIRRAWLSRFTERPGMDFNLYGRIVPDTPGAEGYYRGVCGSSDRRGNKDSRGKNDHMSGKESAYLAHEYMLEFDNFGRKYFSERILDSLLLWAVPIYHGGNLHDYLPPGSFEYLDLDGDGSDVLKIVSDNNYKDRLEAIGAARTILLDELQLWPRVHYLLFQRHR